MTIVDYKFYSIDSYFISLQLKKTRVNNHGYNQIEPTLKTTILGMK